MRPEEAIDPQSVTQEIQSALDAIEKEPALLEEINFARRAEAIESMEFGILDRIEGLLSTLKRPEGVARLERNAKRVLRRLEQVDVDLFRRLRGEIRNGCRASALQSLIEDYVGHDARAERHEARTGYDTLDSFTNGLLLSRDLPPESRIREAEMVFYQPTPARIIFDLVRNARLTRDDVFLDLGSGLGQVAILVNLLSGARSKGVEFEPVYCEYAAASAADLDLSDVEFINADARAADLSDGTVFFMYTPFGGQMLQEVLDRLRDESRARSIRLFTHGPCTLDVARQRWLVATRDSNDNLGAFRSLNNQK